MEHSANGTLGRRILTWVVVAFVAVVLLKLAVGLVIGIVTAALSAVALVALVVVAIWAVRRL